VCAYHDFRTTFYHLYFFIKLISLLINNIALLSNFSLWDVCGYSNDLKEILLGLLYMLVKNRSDIIL